MSIEEVESREVKWASRARCWLCGDSIACGGKRLVTWYTDEARDFDDEDTDDDDDPPTWKAHAHLACAALRELAPEIASDDDAADADDPGNNDLIRSYLATHPDPGGLIERIEDEQERARLLSRYLDLLKNENQLSLFGDTP